MRLAVGVSGGADSVALLCELARRGKELGLVLHAAHLHHGLRGEEADGDLAFCRELAARLGIEFHEARADVAAETRANPESGKTGETIEEAARRVRYSWFRTLLSKTPLHAMATAHTLDDQAETVLAKLLRGAWTEGLGGISPAVEFPEGRILRPLLGTSRAEIESYLKGIGQSWREDSTNRELTFTRNRIRHELLPLLEGWNPRLRKHLAQMAELARDEEAWWETEVARLAPQVILTGRPVRGGGRAAAGGLAIDLSRFAGLARAAQRRLLRHAADQLGAALDFDSTEALRDLALIGRSGQRCEVEGLRAERTAREMRLDAGPAPPGADPAEYTIPIPGEVLASGFGLLVSVQVEPGAQPPASGATLRNWRPGDRVRLRHSSGPRKVKEVLERLRVSGSERSVWPVVEIGGRIAWMKGADVEPEPGIEIRVETASAGA
jgi:tRNA(Ile)-lysidine synthase